MLGPLTVNQDVAPCELHTSHSPITIVNERHHIFPLYLQTRVWGEVQDQRKMVICSTAHNTVHFAIEYYFKNNKWPVNVVGKTRDLAELAITRYQEALAGK